MTQEQNIQQKAVEFLALTENMFNTIDGMVMDERPMKDGEFIILCRQFQELRTYANQFRQNVIYREVHHQQQQRARRQPPQRNTLTREEKLRHKDYDVCPKCKKVLTKQHMPHHRASTETCKHIQHFTTNSKIQRKKVYGNDENYWEKIVPIYEWCEVHKEKYYKNFEARCPIDFGNMGRPAFNADMKMEFYSNHKWLLLYSELSHPDPNERQFFNGTFD